MSTLSAISRAKRDASSPVSWRTVRTSSTRPGCASCLAERLTLIRTGAEAGCRSCQLRAFWHASLRADARARDDIPALECKRRGEHALDAPRYVLRVGRADNLLEQHRKLVAPEPRHYVSRPHRVPQAFRDLLQEAVAPRVA